MSYVSVTAMAGSQSLKSRMIAAAAEAGVLTPQQWVEQNVWALASADGWAEAWDYAVDTATLDVNPDTGVRPGVINDQMIKDAVTALLAEQATPPAE